VILAASRSGRVEQLVRDTQLSRGIVKRFVAGETTADAVRAAACLADRELHATIDFLGEDTTDRATAEATVAAYRELLVALSDAHLTPQSEVSVKLSALGQRIDPALALEMASQICDAARHAGTTVTLDAEDHTTTDGTLEALGKLRKDFPATGAVLQAYLRRTESDCRDLRAAGSRVRLCKGAYNEPESAAFRSTRDVSLSYVRCAKVLLTGDGYPMFATHDPTLIAVVAERADHYRRAIDSFEFQLLHGVRGDEQERLAQAGYTVRIYLPYGAQWYGYMARRLAERPANALFALRALTSRR
jgi:proline dehydrogenase